MEKRDKVITSVINLQPMWVMNWKQTDFPYRYIKQVIGFISEEVSRKKLGFILKSCVFFASQEIPNSNIKQPNANFYLHFNPY